MPLADFAPLLDVRPLTHAQIRYAARKAARRCVQCNAGLLDEEPGPRCTEHEEAHRKAWARMSKTPKHKQTRMARRDARTAEGICLGCPAKPVPGRRRCQACLDVHAAATAEYLDRKEARC